MGWWARARSLQEVEILNACSHPIAWPAGSNLQAGDIESDEVSEHVIINVEDIDDDVE